MSMTDPSTSASPSQPAASRTLTAFFDTRAGAQTAIDDLVAAGVSRDRISLLEDGPEPIESEPMPTADKGFWATLKDLFMPDEDRHGYAEGLRRGGFLVAVRDDGEHHQRVVDILDRDGTVDMDARETTWRAEGWAPARAGRDIMAEESLGRPAVVPPVAPGTPSAATGLGATVPTDELREAYRGAPDVPVAAEPQAIPEDEKTPGRVGRRDEDLGRARVRSYLEEGL